MLTILRTKVKKKLYYNSVYALGKYNYQIQSDFIPFEIYVERDFFVCKVEALFTSKNKV